MRQKTINVVIKLPIQEHRRLKAVCKAKSAKTGRFQSMRKLLLGVATRAYRKGY